MKKFTRTQVREALQDWKEIHTSVEARTHVEKFVDYLDTYQFTEEAKMPGERATGKVKWFNEKKGFGFIMPDEGGDDLFVHFTGLNGRKNLNEGDKVEFDVAKGEKGLKAVDVVVI